MPQCNRAARDGSGNVWYCDRQEGHTGAHRAVWKDRDDILRLGLRWTHENGMGHAVWPSTRGAVEVITTEKGKV